MKNCELCGAEFGHGFEPARLKRRKHCSRACGDEVKRGPRATRNCEACGKAFGADLRPSLLARHRFCSVACSGLAHRSNRTSRACAACGSEFETYNGLWGNRFCSKPCADVDKRNGHDHKAYKRAYHHEHYEPKGRTARTCCQCGDKFMPDTGKGRTRSHEGRRDFCSTGCRQAFWGAKKLRSYRRRAERFGVVHERLDRMLVFERDAWRCQICGRKSLKCWLGTRNPRRPELDHRVPMCKGGPHTYENVQLACLRCNRSKNGRRILGQIPLFARPMTLDRNTVIPPNRIQPAPSTGVTTPQPNASLLT